MNICTDSKDKFKLLLLDHEMFHPEAHRSIFRACERRGWDIDYRRYFPHYCSSDKTNHIVMIYGGRTPGVPGAQMSLEEIPPIIEYARNGGILVLCYYGGSRVDRGSHERYVFNRVLEEAGVNIRINTNWIVDSEQGYPSTLVPSSYLYPLPYIKPYPGSPLGKNVDKVFGGYQSSLSVGKNAAVLLESLQTAVTAHRGEEFSPIEIIGKPDNYKVAASASIGKGYVIVISKFLLNMGDFTGRHSDKPLLDFDRFASNTQLTVNFMDYIIGVAEGSIEWVKNTNHQHDEISMVPEPDFPVSREVIKQVPPHCSDKLTVLEAKSEVSEWVKRNKFRIGYDGISSKSEDRKQLKQLFDESGLNTYFAFNDCQYMYSSKKSEEERQEYRNQWRYAAEMCHAAGLKCFLGSMYPHWEIFRSSDYAHLTDAAGKVYNAPSALDIRFWKDSVFRIAVEMAELSLEQPGITGLYWDLEMYTFPGLNHQEGQAMEDTCFNTFLAREEQYLSEKLKHEASLLNVDKRYPWLRDNGLLKRYYKVLELEVRRLAEELRTVIRDINPNLELALYNLLIPDNWFYRGFLSGLSTPERPIILATYEAGGKLQQQTAAQEGVYYYHCPGCLINALKPDEWEQSLPRLAMEQDGYWLFPFGPLMAHVEHDKMTGDATLNGSRDDEVAGIARANRLLDALLEAQNA